MNINMEQIDQFVNSEQNVLSFLRQLLLQVSQYNSIDIDNLKVLCYIIYKERISEYSQKEINNLVTTILGYITYETKVYKPTFKNCEFDTELIYYTYINNDLKRLFGD